MPAIGTISRRTAGTPKLERENQHILQQHMQMAALLDSQDIGDNRDGPYMTARVGLTLCMQPA